MFNSLYMESGKEASIGGKCAAQDARERTSLPVTAFDVQGPFSRFLRPSCCQP